MQITFVLFFVVESHDLVHLTSSQVSRLIRLSFCPSTCPSHFSVSALCPLSPPRLVISITSHSRSIHNKEFANLIGDWNAAVLSPLLWINDKTPNNSWGFGTSSGMRSGYRSLLASARQFNMKSMAKQSAYLYDNTDAESVLASKEGEYDEGEGENKNKNISPDKTPYILRTRTSGRNSDTNWEIITFLSLYSLSVEGRTEMLQQKKKWPISLSISLHLWVWHSRQVRSLPLCRLVQSQAHLCQCNLCLDHDHWQRTDRRENVKLRSAPRDDSQSTLQFSDDADERNGWLRQQHIVHIFLLL